MKCKGCGAPILKDTLKCEYCGRENKIAVRRKKEIDGLVKDNDELLKDTLKSSGKLMFYRAHKKFNLLLVIMIVILLALDVAVAVYRDNRKETLENVSQSQLDEFYEAGDVKAIYLAVLGRGEGLYVNDDEATRIARIYDSYKDFMRHIGFNRNEINRNGKHDKYDLNSIIDNACEVIFYGNDKYDEELSDHGKEMLEEYRKVARAYLIGTLKIPAERIDSVDYIDYDGIGELTQLAMEVELND